MLCGMVFVLPVSLVPPIPVSLGPLLALPPEFVFGTLAVPAAFEAPVVVLALLEPPRVLVLLSLPQPAEHMATAAKSRSVDIRRIEFPFSSQIVSHVNRSRFASSIKRAARSVPGHFTASTTSSCASGRRDRPGLTGLSF